MCSRRGGAEKRAGPGAPPPGRDAGRAPTPARRAYRPDRLRNYELGAKLNLLDQRLDVRAAAFYDLWDDIQSDQYFPSGLPYTANVGDGRNVGLEVEATWRPAPGWALQSNALFDDPKIPTCPSRPC